MLLVYSLGYEQHVCVCIYVSDVQIVTNDDCMICHNGTSLCGCDERGVCALLFFFPLIAVVTLRHPPLLLFFFFSSSSIFFIQCHPLVTCLLPGIY